MRALERLRGDPEARGGLGLAALFGRGGGRMPETVGGERGNLRSFFLGDLAENKSEPEQAAQQEHLCGLRGAVMPPGVEIDSIARLISERSLYGKLIRPSF